MSKTYLEYHFKVHPVRPGLEILIAQLGELGFESFEEQENGLKAYIRKGGAELDIADHLSILSSGEFEITFAVHEIEPVNWNEAWEQNFEPIEVDGRCAVRAPFHEHIPVEYEVVIMPKMSFGTGHHETTHLMIKHLLKCDFEGKKVLDMGCGTGVLAILAALRGAMAVDAIDIDRWSFENAQENVELNSVNGVKVMEGDVKLLSGKSYDAIIANINRNVLLKDIPAYAKSLNVGGLLLLSGFYTDDIPLISERCNEYGLHFVNNYERNNWVACKFRKSQ